MKYEEQNLVMLDGMIGAPTRVEGEVREELGDVGEDGRMMIGGPLFV